MAQDEEEDEILWSRFSGEKDVEHWFLMIFVIFVSLVDRKRFSGPLTIVERLLTYLHNLHYKFHFQTFTCIELSTKFCLPCHIN